VASGAALQRAAALAAAQAPKAVAQAQSAAPFVLPAGLELGGLRLSTLGISIVPAGFAGGLLALKAGKGGAKEQVGPPLAPGCVGFGGGGGGRDWSSTGGGA
jgi:hypothetical protein